MEFKSSRLEFRQLTADDYELISSVFSDEEIMKYAYWDVSTDKGEMQSFIYKLISNNTAEKRDSYGYAVFSASDGRFVGIALILLHYHMSRVKDGEIGYFLLKEFWGRGFATEIAETLTDFCFGRLKLQKVVASCNANNFRSENVMKKIGMLREGVIRRDRYKDGRWDDELRYGILAEEWEERKGRGSKEIKFTLTQTDPYSTEALILMDELSASLDSITGSSGKASFDPRDVCVSRALFVIARNEAGEAIGCGALRPIDDRMAEVKRMYARTKGMGIGSGILTYLEDQARQMGYTAMRLETRLVNEKAVAFYENRGYRRIPNYGMYEGRPEAVCFEKLF